MRFVDERKSNAIVFEKIDIGQVFFIEDTNKYGQEPYMRIFEIIDEDEYCLNAVNLLDAQTVFVEDGEKVIKCEACLKIY